MTTDYGYEGRKVCKSDSEFAKCKPKHPKPKKALLECGEGTGSRTFTSSDDTPFQLAHVTLDTTCLNRPEVLIKFSSIVSMVNLATGQQTGTVRLQYELFRVCDDEEPKSLGIWMFEEVNVETDGFRTQEESFSFIFCECTNCPRCCEYFVTVTPVEMTNARTTVSNGRMAALSQSLCDYLKDEHKTYGIKCDDVKFIQKYSKPKDILLACGQGNGSVVFRGEPELEPSVNIAHATIDTTCLSKPKVLIEFSSVIKIDNDTIDISLQFELFRVCGDGEPLSRGIWRFQRTGVDGFIELEKVFDFTFCECEAPGGCCEYFVTIIPIEVDTGTDIEADVVVDNARIVALAQSSRDCFYYDDCKTHDGKGDCIDCKPKHPTPKEILLECGEGTGSRTFASSNDSAFQLAHVTIDTTCLCKPMVNIEFSSIVSFEGIRGSGDGRLRYELFKVCDNRRPISLGIWISERIDFTDFERTTNIFNFTFCDCMTCPGCCDYFITVTPIRIDDTIITVSNGRIAALAQEG